MYLNRIKPENIYAITLEQAEQLHCYECRYCGGLIGDVRVHKQDFATSRQVLQTPRNIQPQIRKGNVR